MVTHHLPLLMKPLTIIQHYQVSLPIHYQLTSAWHIYGDSEAILLQSRWWRSWEDRSWSTQRWYGYAAHRWCTCCVMAYVWQWFTNGWRLLMIEWLTMVEWGMVTGASWWFVTRAVRNPHGGRHKMVITTKYPWLNLHTYYQKKDLHSCCPFLIAHGEKYPQIGISLSYHQKDRIPPGWINICAVENTKKLLHRTARSHGQEMSTCTCQALGLLRSSVRCVDLGAGAPPRSVPGRRSPVALGGPASHGSSIGKPWET